MARASIGGNGGSALRVAPLAGLGFVAAAVALLALYTLAHLHADEDMGGLKAELFQLRRDLAIVREETSVRSRARPGRPATAPPRGRPPRPPPRPWRRAGAARMALLGSRGAANSPCAQPQSGPAGHRGGRRRGRPRHENRGEDDEVVRDCYIFTLWDYPKGAPAFATTNLEAWDRHARGLCSGGIVLLNDSNIPRWIPDMPKEYYRLEYRAAQSDAVRYSAIFHNGGMYIDADFIVTQDLGDIITRVSTYDLISYTTGGQQCKPAGTFSSNFMAGKKGSLLHKAVWDAQKAALTNHCQPSEMKLEKVCCLDDPGVLCHIPWTQLGEGISHRVLGDLFKKKSNREGLKVFCFGGDESLAPADIETVLSKKPMLDEALAHFESKNIRNPLGRIAYHLYSSSATMSGGSMKSLKRAQLFDERLFLGKLYSLSFQNSGPGPMSQQLFDAEGPSAGDLSGRALQALKVAVPPECGVGTGLGSARPWACAGVVAAARKNFAWRRARALARLRHGGAAALAAREQGVPRHGGADRRRGPRVGGAGPAVRRRPAEGGRPFADGVPLRRPPRGGGPARCRAAARRDPGEALPAARRGGRDGPLRGAPAGPPGQPVLRRRRAGAVAGAVPRGGGRQLREPACPGELARPRVRVRRPPGECHTPLAGARRLRRLRQRRVRRRRCPVRLVPGRQRGAAHRHGRQDRFTSCRFAALAAGPRSSSSPRDGARGRR
ncbi:unnamed protein product [Prorocentrum cordatum]|uniref:Alpha 1,4-glycosyltransferase domain-containing protein n=1 Tax=Prorocentrum cordatum TaxID=2364126 RepID=A0ABN9R0Z7_9DINO|nr:unnamed protein product [Polarella glacialis]